MKKEFLEDLVGQPPMFVAQRWVIDRTPHIFNGDQVAYVRWKSELATQLGVDGRAITLVGSASVGISLNPHKDFGVFHDGSDVDVAVISEHHFSIGWHMLRSLGARRHGLTQRQKASFSEHVAKYIYYGTFDTRSLLLQLPFGAAWRTALEKMRMHHSTLGREINIRIYRDYEALSSYHVANLKKLRDIVLSKE